MAKYTSKAVVLAVTKDEAYRNLTNLSAFQERLKNVPKEMLDKIGNIEFSENSIKFNTPQVGELQFDVVGREENKDGVSLVKFQAARSPIPLSLAIFISDKEGKAELTSEIDVEIPAMLRPMLGGKMQEAAEKFNEMICTIGGNQL